MHEKKGEHPGYMSFMLMKCYAFVDGSGSQLFIFYHNAHNIFSQSMLSVLWVSIIIDGIIILVFLYFKHQQSDVLSVSQETAFVA